MQIAGDATRVGARGRDRFKAFYGGGTLLWEVTTIVVLPECEFLKAVLRGITDHRTRTFAHETARVIATSLNGEGALHLRAENHGGIHTDDGQQFSRTTTAAAQQFSHRPHPTEANPVNPPAWDLSVDTAAVAEIVLLTA